MTYEKIFGEVKKTLKKGDTSKLNGTFSIQCNIQGEGEGSFYIEFKDGALNVEPYDYKGASANIYASGETYIDMFTGKLDGGKAFEDGLLKFDGDVGAVLALKNIEKPSAKKEAAKKEPAKKEASKASAKPAEKPAVKKEASTKPAPKAEVKAPAKVEAKPAAKPVVKPPVKEEPKPVSKPVPLPPKDFFPEKKTK